MSVRDGPPQNESVKLIWAQNGTRLERKLNHSYEPEKPPCTLVLCNPLKRKDDFLITEKHYKVICKEIASSRIGKWNGWCAKSIFWPTRSVPCCRFASTKTRWTSNLSTPPFYLCRMFRNQFSPDPKLYVIHTATKYELGQIGTNSVTSHSQ